MRRCHYRATCLAGALFTGCTAPTTPPAQTTDQRSHPTTTFNVSNDFSPEAGAWTLDYLQRANTVLTRLMNAPDLPPPREIQVILQNNPDAGGSLAGAAEVGLLFFAAANWPEEKHRHWIIAHELANVLAHHYASGGGFPSDFWSNGRSPFPEYASCLVMRELGLADEAAWRRSVHEGKPDHDLYWQLHDRYGFDLFARFFALLRHDGVVLGDINASAAPWPATDRTRSLYTIAYLSIAAGDNLAPLFRAAGIGQEPPDWQARHPDKPFTEYEITDADVATIMRRRADLFGGAKADLDARRERYRKGLAP